MKLIHAITKSALLLCSIIALNTAKANTMNDDDIHCPSVDIVRAGASTLSETLIDENGNYFVMGLFPFYSDKNVDWLVATGDFTANNDEEAIVKGREIVANVESRVSDMPTKDILTTCGYYSGSLNNPTTRVLTVALSKIAKKASLIDLMVRRMKMNK
jgi:hypothetical protein